MEHYDPQLAQRVWQRVQNREAQPEVSGLEALLSEKRADAAALAQLARQFHGVRREILGKLAQEARSQVACLRGVYRLVTGQWETGVPSQRTEGTTEAALCRCCAGKLRCLGLYEGWFDSREYAGVFRQLADRETRQLQQLLELLGSGNESPKGLA